MPHTILQSLKYLILLNQASKLLHKERVEGKEAGILCECTERALRTALERCSLTKQETY